MRFLISLFLTILVTGCSVHMPAPEPIVVEVVPVDPVIIYVPEIKQVPGPKVYIKQWCKTSMDYVVSQIDAVNKKDYADPTNPKQSLLNYIRALEKNNDLMESVVKNYYLDKANCNE